VEWLTDFIKHLTISRVVSFAVAVTCASLLFGPLVLPGYMEQLSKEWKVFAYTGLIFSSVLLTTWALQELWSACKSVTKTLIASWRARNITKDELAFLCLMGQRGNETFNLTIRAQGAPGLTKLEILALTKSLESKGLVEVSSCDETISWLTQKGRARAIIELRKERVDDA